MTVVSKHLSTQTTIGAVEGFFDAYRRRNVNDMLQYCNPKGRARMVPLGADGEGEIQTVGKNLWSSLFDAFPDLRINVTSIFADLDGHACVEAVMQGTQAKAFDGLESQGKTFELSSAFIFDVGFDERIQKVTVYWDNAALYKQLGQKER